MSAQRSLFDFRLDAPEPCTPTPALEVATPQSSGSSSSQPPACGGTPGFEPKPVDVASAVDESSSRTFEINVVRSKRRTRTVGARLKGNVLEVSVPAWMSRADVDRHVDDMVRRFQKRSQSAAVDLTDRARSLARRYDLPAPASIRWVENMAHRWGSCTMSDRTIRISNGLAAYPPWVLDAVIVHELCHLVHGDHSAAFWALANRYPKMERARGYLIAKSGTDDESD